VLRVAATADVPNSVLREMRAMLDAAFEGRFTDTDWETTIGGVHVWLSHGADVISHGAVVPRVLDCSGQRLSVGYVEAVATASLHRQRGHASAVMRRLADLIRENYDMGALSTGAYAFYEALGWERWAGPTFVTTARGTERTPYDDGSIMILRTPRTPRLDVSDRIVCEWRVGDVW
jgi:aminoglycoside 2'-N-acetyltransferase I